MDITVESQRSDRRKDSVQAFMARYLAKNPTLDVLIDVHRPGKAADLVGIRIVGGELYVTLVRGK